MFKLFGGKGNRTEQKKVKLNSQLEGRYLTKSLNQNADELRALFKDDDTFRERYVENINDSQLKYYIFFTDGVVDSWIINRSVIEPLNTSTAVRPGKGLIDTLMNRVILCNEIRKTNQYKDIVESITYGGTILFAEGESEALILNTKEFSIRSVEEPNNEKTLSGPREGYTEVMTTNLSLVRRKIRSNDLKMKRYQIGKRTKTDVCIVYLESLAKKQIIEELLRRLNRIDIDGVIDSNYISELIGDAPYSPFTTVGYTERPDVTVGKLLEGRVALFVDGTPIVLTVPYLFVENIQSSEDYYLNYYFTSFSRMLRVIGLLLTTSVPALYIAIVGFHHEMIPTNLVISIATQRKSVPLPAVIECFIMLGVFELIRETGARMPSNIGQALSIVGALVIGDAAVQANLVAAPMIIVVGITGISSLLIPKMYSVILYIRVFLLIASSMFGFYGFALAGGAILIHIMNLRSFGVPQVMAEGNLRADNLKDTYIRAPWFKMRTRPKMLSEDPIRMETENVPNKD